MGGGRVDGLILAGELVQPVGERLFGLRSAILAGICPNWTCLGLVLALERFYVLVATVRGSPMVKRVRSGVIARVGVAISIDGQLKVGGHL